MWGSAPRPAQGTGPFGRGVGAASPQVVTPFRGGSGGGGEAGDRGRGTVFQQLPQGGDGGAAEVAERLVQGGEGGGGVRRQFQVVEADHQQVGAHGNAAGQGQADQAQGQAVVDGEDADRSFPRRQPRRWAVSRMRSRVAGATRAWR